MGGGYHSCYAGEVRYGLLLVGTALSVSAWGAPRAGKVVRIERRAHGAVGIPRMCTVSSGDGSGFCITGKAPEIGDHLQIVDNQHVLGVVRLTQVTVLPDACAQQTVWMIQWSLETGDLTRPDGAMIGVLDGGIDPRAGRLVQVDHSPTGHPFGSDQVYGLDANGDGAADTEFVQFACDDGGTLSPNATGTCVEVWQQTTPVHFERTRADRFRNCF
jgi:hypothetical protein